MTSIGVQKNFTINEFISVKLKKNRTNIYIKGKYFRQCKYLLINLEKESLEKYDEIRSIDEAADNLDNSLEYTSSKKRLITPETEFWGHCSNLQAWVEHGYDTRLLHRNLAFPLLKRLTDVGDPQASKVFKEEIAKRFLSGYPTVIRYLIIEGYIAYLNRDESELIYRNIFEKIKLKKQSGEPFKVYLLLVFLNKYLLYFKYPQECIRKYEALIQLDPNDQLIWIKFKKFFRILVEDQNNPLPTFMTNTEFKVGNYNFWKNVGYYYLFKGHPKKAISAFEKCLELAPFHKPAFHALIRSYEVMFYFEKASRICKDLRQMSKNDNHLLVKQCYLSFKSVFPILSYNFFDNIIDLEYVLNLLSVKKKIRDKSKQDLHKLLNFLMEASQKLPKKLIIWNLLSIVFIEMRQFSNALNALKEVIKIRPKVPLIYHNVGFLYKILKNIKKAKKFYKKALEINPRLAVFWIDLSKLYSREGNYKFAIRICKLGLDYNSKSLILQNRLTVLYLITRAYEKAYFSCKSALRMLPVSPAKPKTPKGYIVVVNEKSFIKEHTLNQSSYEYASAWRNMGYYYYKQKNYNEALISLNKSLKYNQLQPFVKYLIKEIKRK